MTARAVPSNGVVVKHHLRGNYIGGKWREWSRNPVIHDENPGDTHDSPGPFVSSSAIDAAAAVEAATASEQSWRACGAVTRGRILGQAAALMTERSDTLARAISWENGKTLREATGEVARAAEHLAFYAGEGRRLNGIAAPADEPHTLALAERVAIGPVALITPFNFPLAIPAWKLGAALVAGCPVVWKPSPHTPLSAASLVEILEEAGMPAGVVNLVQGGSGPGKALVEQRAIRAVSFTGSCQVGMLIRQASSNRLVRTQLELGGSNALVVLADADLEAAAQAAVAGAFGQAGQRCSATSRVIVDVKVKSDFIDLLELNTRALRVGYGFNPEAQMGPLIDESHVVRCENAVAEAVTLGGRLVCGGQRVVDGVPDGHYFLPTVVADVASGSQLATEEVFGPVLGIIDCSGADDAVDILNSVRFGMAASIFSANVGAALAMRERLDVGMVHVNRPGTGAYSHLPHVGTKDSQHGPAECGAQGLEFFTQWRTTCARLGTFP